MTNPPQDDEPQDRCEYTDSGAHQWVKVGMGREGYVRRCELCGTVED